VHLPSLRAPNPYPVSYTTESLNGDPPTGALRPGHYLFGNAMVLLLAHPPPLAEAALLLAAISYPGNRSYHHLGGQPVLLTTCFVDQFMQGVLFEGLFPKGCFTDGIAALIGFSQSRQQSLKLFCCGLGLDLRRQFHIHVYSTNVLSVSFFLFHQSGASSPQQATGFPRQEIS
jgi:hypothetical protein